MILKKAILQLFRGSLLNIDPGKAKVLVSGGNFAMPDEGHDFDEGDTLGEHIGDEGGPQIVKLDLRNAKPLAKLSQGSGLKTKPPVPISGKDEIGE